jgi:hypothetical protein
MYDVTNENSYQVRLPIRCQPYMTNIIIKQYKYSCIDRPLLSIQYIWKEESIPS